MPIVRVMVETVDLPEEDDRKKWFDVRADIDIVEMKNAVDDLEPDERRKYILGLAQDWGIGSDVEEEVARLRDRVRYGGFDEGSALDVLERLVDILDQSRSRV